MRPVWVVARVSQSSRGESTDQSKLKKSTHNIWRLPVVNRPIKIDLRSLPCGVALAMELQMNEEIET